jgi:serine phosphatase RsbU (regulator of sigma subunit)
MHSLFNPRNHDAAPAVEPVATVFPAIVGADLSAAFVGNRIAGDFYDSIRVSPQRVLVGLLDVAGRRQDTRQILSVAQGIFRTFGPELFSPQDVNEADAMTELAIRLNRGLIETAGVLSCPAFLACYHETFGTLCYANAGHTPALVRDSRGIVELGSTGLPLGLFSHATAEARMVGLEDQAILLAVSRGVVTCEGHNGSSKDEYGLERVKSAFQNAPPSDAKTLCAAVLGSASDFGARVPMCDDRTAMALVRTA